MYSFYFLGRTFKRLFFFKVHISTKNNFLENLFVMGLVGNLPEIEKMAERNATKQSE